MSQPPPFPAPEPGLANLPPPGSPNPYVVAPYFIRQETAWTFPLQVATCAFFLFSAAASILVLLHEPDLRDSINQGVSQSLANSGGSGRYTPEDIQKITGAAVGIVTGLAVFWAVLKAFLGAGGLLRWGWLWITELIVLCFFAFFGLFSEIALVVEAVGGRVNIPTAIQAVLSLAADGLLVWMLIANFRFGAWAVQKVPWTPPPEQVAY